MNIQGPGHVLTPVFHLSCVRIRQVTKNQIPRFEEKVGVTQRDKVLIRERYRNGPTKEMDLTGEETRG